MGERLSPTSKLHKAPCCAFEGVPEEASLGQLERLLLPYCAGRIVAIGLQLHGQGVVEFEREQDADACVGKRELLGKVLSITRREASGISPNKRRKRSPTKTGHVSSPLAVDNSGILEYAAPAAAESQPAKKKGAESKKEKEKRLNRVGLSYRCGRCGQPKKGHVCNLTDAELEQQSRVGSDEDGDGFEDGRSRGGGWDLDSEALFKDIKSVLTRPAMIPNAANSASSGAAAGAPAPATNSSKASSSGGKAAQNKAAADPPEAPPSRPAAKAKRKPPASAKLCPPPEPEPEPPAEKMKILEELEMEMQRPPALITPDESDNVGRAAGPNSVTSNVDLFSPGQLMTTLLGTPTPGPPGLSPGTLNELGNLLQSPTSMLASARKTRSETVTDAAATSSAI